MDNKFDWFILIGFSFITVLGFILMVFIHDFSGLIPIILGTILIFVLGKKLFKERKRNG